MWIHKETYLEIGGKLDDIYRFWIFLAFLFLRISVGHQLLPSGRQNLELIKSRHRILQCVTGTAFEEAEHRFMIESLRRYSVGSTESASQ